MMPKKVNANISISLSNTTVPNTKLLGRLFSFPTIYVLNISPKRNGSTLFPKYPISTALYSDETEGEADSLNSHFQRNPLTQTEPHKNIVANIKYTKSIY